MNIILADFGSYSLKICRFKIDKAGIIPIEYFEELTPPAVLPKTPEQTEDGDEKKQDTKQQSLLSETHMQLLSEYLLTHAPKDKSVFIIPEWFLSSRLLHLPLKSRKKAELMVPHQLEESVPYGIENLHLLSKFQKSSIGFDVMVEFATHKDIGALYQQLKKENILPHLLTSTTMLTDEYVQWFLGQGLEEESQLDRTWAMADIGHLSTKVFVYQGNRIVGKHTIAFGGKNYDQGIAGAYKITMEEARAYKHKNAFFLTSQQLQNSGKDETVFAEVMKDASLPLIQELRRYFVSLKVKVGATVEFCYFTGGGQRIPNFIPFISEKLELPASELPLQECLHPKAKKFEGGQIHSFGVSVMAAVAHIKGATIPNLLRGQYSASHQELIPLTSTSFVATRSLILASILAFGLLIEKIFLYTDLKQVNSQISAILKSPQLGLNAKEERTYKTRPEKLTPIISKKEKELAQGVSTLSSAARVNAVSALSNLSTILRGNQKVDVILFENIEGLAKAVIKSSSKEELKKVADFLSGSSLKIVQKQFSKDELTLTVSFDGH